MEYNTTRNKLKIREYGRNIQKMIEYAMTIQDKKKRTEVCKYIINSMAQMNPHIRDVGDARQKLWDHLHIISDFKLDIDSPYPPPSPQAIYKKPQRIHYQDTPIEFRHYGKNIKNIIDMAIKYEEGEEKEALVRAIANHLKKSYLTWNRESVDDSLIYEHLELLSNGKLSLNRDVPLNQTNDILARNKKKKSKRDNNSSKENSRSKKDKR